MNLYIASSSSQLDLTLANTRAFLLDAQDENGAWRDFLLPAGLSTSWVTAYVGEALLTGDLPDKATLNAAERAWQFLIDSTTTEGGWSYNSSVPADADSTLWGIRFASALGHAESECAQGAIAFFNKHRGTDGGIKTYAQAKPIRRYIGVPAFVSFKGWTQSHVCVSAAGANLNETPIDLIEYLIQTQNQDGSWPAYFWFDNEYSTGEAVSALIGFREAAASTEPAIDASIERAVDWLMMQTQKLVSSQSSRPPAFALGCTVRALALHNRNQAIDDLLERAGKCFTKWQRENGAWGPTARLRVPPPKAITPKENASWTRWEGMPSGRKSLANILKYTFNNFSPDHRGLFTGATALRALHQISALRNKK